MSREDIEFLSAFASILSFLGITILRPRSFEEAASGIKFAGFIVMLMCLGIIMARYSAAPGSLSDAVSKIPSASAPIGSANAAVINQPASNVPASSHTVTMSDTCSVSKDNANWLFLNDPSIGSVAIRCENGFLFAIRCDGDGNVTFLTTAFSGLLRVQVYQDHYLEGYDQYIRQSNNQNPSSYPLSVDGYGMHQFYILRMAYSVLLSDGRKNMMINLSGLNKIAKLHMHACL